eukprot:3613357-Amphidinium_carterae.1
MPTKGKLLRISLVYAPGCGGGGGGGVFFSGGGGGACLGPFAFLLSSDSTEATSSIQHGTAKEDLLQTHEGCFSQGCHAIEVRPCIFLLTYHVDSPNARLVDLHTHQH